MNLSTSAVMLVLLVTFRLNMEHVSMATRRKQATVHTQVLMSATK